MNKPRLASIRYKELTGEAPPILPHGGPAEIKRGIDAYFAKRPDMQGPTGWRSRRQRGLGK